MKNKHLWKPTKFVPTKDGYLPSSDPQMVGVSSRLTAAIQLKACEELLRKHARGLLADLGCGNVPLYGIYKDYVSDNICVDWAGSLHSRLHLDYEFDLNQPIPLKEETFDTILLTDVLEHISAPNLLIQETARLLTPQGKLIVLVPFLYWLHETPHDYYRYTRFALRKFCQENKLKILHLKAYGGAPEVVLDILAKHLELSKILSRFQSLFLSLSTLFVRSSFGKRLSLRTSEEFPLGYCLVALKP